MSKKIILHALTVAAVTMFAWPAAASAQEIHWTNTAAFTGSAGPGTITIPEEPTFTFESVDIQGTPSAGGTTGSIHLDFTGCHIAVGFTFKCHTLNSALDNTVTTTGTYHLITIAGSKPAILVTLNTFKITTAGISNMIVTGNVIGTITSPACGGESKTTAISFSATGGTQNHLEYTGLKYDLLAETEASGKLRTAGLTMSGSVSQTTAGKLECT